MKQLLTFTAVVSITACGCVPSLHSFFEKEDVTFEKGLLGTWKQEEDKSTWVFSQYGGNKQKYKLVVGATEGNELKKAEFEATLFRLNDVSYLNLRPAGDPFAGDVSSFYKVHVLPAHSLTKIERKEGVLRVSMMNPKWAKQRLRAHPREIAHTMADNRVVLTASTADLQGFVKTHANTPGAYMNPVALKKE